MKTSTAVVLYLGVLGLAGFGLAAYMTRDKNPAGAGISGNKTATYRTKVFTDGTKFFAAVFRDGDGQSEVVTTIGPLDTKEEAAKQGVAYVNGIGAARFYVLYQNAQGAWMLDGYSRLGGKVYTDGPFADEQAATTAGANWASEPEAS